ncbi:hypothetical protein MKX01_016883 [Papaver californicum]|nr:hypothetical protein MKX01_016883 [Papaver californicum]
MGGGSIENEWELASLTSGTDDPKMKTIVLVGRTGNGKSATGNSILRRKAFKSRLGCSGVTNTSELQITVLDDGQVVNVIDTPGIFDSSEGTEQLRKEIVKCIGLAKNGIHAFLLVFSTRTRFSQEEETALQYMRDFLDVIKLCGNRVLLFDNKTKDEKQRVEQVESLMSLVNSLIAHNSGLPYTNELFEEMKKGATLKPEINNQNDRLEEHIHRITEMVEMKLKETTLRLERDLETERAARAKAEKNWVNATDAEKKSADETRKMQKQLVAAHREAEQARAHREAEQARARASNFPQCVIL